MVWGAQGAVPGAAMGAQPGSHDPSPGSLRSIHHSPPIRCAPTAAGPPALRVVSDGKKLRSKWERREGDGGRSAKWLYLGWEDDTDSSDSDGVEVGPAPDRPSAAEILKRAQALQACRMASSGAGSPRDVTVRAALRFIGWERFRVGPGGGSAQEAAIVHGCMGSKGMVRSLRPLTLPCATLHASGPQWMTLRRLVICASTPAR